MAQQIINVGVAPNDGTGDTLKTSFTKTNQNFAELYAGAGSAGNVNSVPTPTAGQIAEWTDATHIKGVAPATVFNKVMAGFRANKNGVNQTLTGGGYTKISFTFEDYDQGSFYDAVNSRWIPPAGMVHIFANVWMTGGQDNSSTSVGIYKNGSAVKWAAEVAVAGGYAFPSVSLDDVSSGSDYYEVYGFSNNAPIAQGDLLYTWFQGHVLGGPKGDAGAQGASGTVTGTLSMPQGRLSLLANTPVQITTLAAATSIYYNPYVGDRVPIYDGTGWSMMAIATFLACSTTDTTKNPSAIGVSKVNDWFIWNDAGTLRLSHGPDWTNDTTRSAGTLLVMQNGIWVNNAAITNACAAQRGTYVGTTRSSTDSKLYWQYGTAVVGAGGAYLWVWNAYNRVDIVTRVSDTTSTWVYGTTTVRPANNSLNYRVSWLAGLAEDAGFVTNHQMISGTASGAAIIGVGLDSTTVFFGNTGWNTCGTSNGIAIIADVVFQPQLGAHFLQALEWAGAGNTFNGDQSAGAPLIDSGLSFRYRM